MLLNSAMYYIEKSYLFIKSSIKKGWKIIKK